MFRRVANTMACLFLGLSIVICGLIWAQSFHSVEAEPFNAMRWRSYDRIWETNFDPGCYRGGMALGAIKQGLLNKKAQFEIEVLLGAPERKIGERWFYPVGQCSGDMKDSDLVVVFSERGLVDDADLRRNE